MLCACLNMSHTEIRTLLSVCGSLVYTSVGLLAC